MLFIPKGRSQLLRDKIKAKVKATPTGRPPRPSHRGAQPRHHRVAKLLPICLPGSTGVRQARPMAVVARQSWLGKKHGTAANGKLRRIYTERGGKGSGWRWGGKQLARFAEAKRLRYPDRGIRIPNGWNDPNEQFRKELIRSGKRPAPSLHCEGHPWLRPRMESRMRETRTSGSERGAEETWPGNGARRFIPTLPATAAILSLSPLPRRGR